MIKVMVISSQNTLVLSSSINKWYENHPSIKKEDIINVSFSVEQSTVEGGRTTYRYVVTYEEKGGASVDGELA